LKTEDFAKQLKELFNQHISLIKSNTQLLEINLDLMRKNTELIKELEKRGKK